MNESISCAITNKRLEYATHQKFFLVFLLILSKSERERERERRRDTLDRLSKFAGVFYISHPPLYNLLELPADLSTLLAGLGGLSPELVRDRIPLDLPEGNFTLLKKVQ